MTHQNETWYEAFRFHIETSHEIDWPWILDKDPEGERLAWARSSDVVFMHNPDTTGHRKKKGPRLRIALFAKAFGGAPVWTRSEALLVGRAFSTYGFKTVGRIPTDKGLNNHYE